MHYGDALRKYKQLQNLFGMQAMNAEELFSNADHNIGIQPYKGSQLSTPSREFQLFMVEVADEDWDVQFYVNANDKAGMELDGDPVVQVFLDIGVLASI